MSYADMVAITRSEALADRIRMCATQEIDHGISPEWWVAVHIERLATQPGWSEAFASAKTNGIEDPGADEAVITDGMILSAVQALVAQDNAADAAKKQAQQQAEDAKKAAEAKAEEARRTREREDQEWHMRTQARIAAEPATPAASDAATRSATRKAGRKA